MKPLLSYYGGKQKIGSKIVAEIDKIPHSIYIEPFCGGAAVLFEKSTVLSHNYQEVINDLNENLITFYKVAKQKPKELNDLVQATLHSKSQHKEAKAIYDNPTDYSDLEIAWAVWVVTNQSFAKIIGGGWAFSKRGQNNAFTTHNRKQKFEESVKRLEGVNIECDDALKVIEKWDDKNSLFYLDPPYINTDQGRYKGYSEDDYRGLINLLSKIEGSFILSGYENNIVPKEWRSIDIKAVMSASKKKENIEKERIEKLWIVKNNSMIKQDLLQGSLFPLNPNGTFA